MEVVSGDEAVVGDVTDLSSGVGAGCLLDHDGSCDFDFYGAICESIRCQGQGLLCQTAEYDSDSDYNLCDEFEGLDALLRRGRSDIGCSCDQRVVGPLGSHICCANLKLARLKHNGNIDEIGAEIHHSEDDFERAMRMASSSVNLNFE